MRWNKRFSVKMLLKLFLVYGACQVVFCKDRTLSIGGIFEHNALHKKAFLYAVDAVNNDDSYKTILRPILDDTVEQDNPFSALNGTCALLTKGVQGIFGPRSTSNIDIVQSISYAKEIPHILATWEGTTNKNNDLQINVHPSPSLLLGAYVDILKGLEWDSFTLLYTSSQGLMRMGELIGLAKDAGITVYVENLDEYRDGDYRPILDKLRGLEQKHFVLDCELELLNEILIQIQQMGLLSVGHNYFLTNLGVHQEDLTTFKYSGANITGVRLINPESTLVRNVSTLLNNIIQYYYPMDSNWNLGSETALIVDAVHLFTNALKNLNVSSVKHLDCKGPYAWNDGVFVSNAIKTSSYEGLTGKIEFDRDGHRNVFELNIFQLDKDGITEKGTWNSSDGLILNADQQSEEDGLDESLRDTNFVVGLTLTEPYSMLKEDSKPLSGNDRYEGFAVDLLHEIARVEGFNYTFRVRPDYNIGHFDAKTKKWTGVIGDLVERKIDMAISDITITQERADAVDFTIPFMTLGISILFQKPTAAPPDFWNFAKPLSYSYWKALGIVFVVVNVSLFMVGRLCPSEWQEENSCQKGSTYRTNYLTFANTFWFVAGGFCRQSTRVKVRSIPAMIIAATWWLLCFVTISFYISSRMTLGTIDQYVPLFTDVQSLVDVAAKHDIRYGAKMGGATFEFFKNSKRPVYRKIFKYMDEHPEDLVISNSEGVELAQTTRYAFFMESTSLEYETKRHCQLMQYGGLLDQKGYGIALPKDSPYYNRLNSAIVKLQETGKLSELKRKWWTEKRGGGSCEADEDFDIYIEPMSVVEISGLIWITVWGTILATVIAVWEFSTYVYKLSRFLKISFTTAFMHELQRCLTRNVKKRVKDEALIPKEPEDSHNGTMETVEMT